MPRSPYRKGRGRDEMGRHPRNAQEPAVVGPNSIGSMIIGLKPKGRKDPNDREGTRDRQDPVSSH